MSFGICIRCYTKNKACVSQVLSILIVRKRAVESCAVSYSATLCTVIRFLVY